MSKSELNRDSLNRLLRIQVLVEDWYRRRSAGEMVSDQSLIAAYPELMPELSVELKKHQDSDESWGEPGKAATEDWSARTTDHISEGGSGRLEVRCPSCHTPITVEVDTSFTDLT